MISEAVKNIFCYKPGNIALYKLAFRHKSAAVSVTNGMKHCNERLEYLGDAVLGSIIAEYLFKKFPYKDEGFLTEMRSRIVSRNNLNFLSKKLGLDKLVMSSLDNISPSCSITGDAFEAFIGAVYLDKGYVFTQNIIINRILNLHIDIDELVNTEVNFKSRIIEYAQKEKKQAEFILANEIENGKRLKLYEVKLLIDGELVAEGKDYSIKKAEQNAAARAWEKIIP